MEGGQSKVVVPLPGHVAGWPSRRAVLSEWRAAIAILDAASCFSKLLWPRLDCHHLPCCCPGLQGIVLCYYKRLWEGPKKADTNGCCVCLDTSVLSEHSITYISSGFEKSWSSVS